MSWVLVCGVIEGEGVMRFFNWVRMLWGFEDIFVMGLGIFYRSFWILDV